MAPKKEDFLHGRAAEELYFIAISLILAFGILQTTGAALETDKPVVSVVSCSMYPSLHVGDIVVVNGEKYDNIKEGEILVYSSRQANITYNGHRYSLENYGEPEVVETRDGKMALISIADAHTPTGERTSKGAIIRINGQKYRLTEGKTYQIKGDTVTVNSVTGVSIPIVHRVIKKNSEYLETKGDNNARQLLFEQKVTPEQIHGTALAVVPRIGGIKLLVMDLVGFNGDKPLVIDSYPSCRERV